MGEANPVLVTGAGGFVGGAVCRALSAAGHAVRGQYRRHPPPPGVAGLRLDLAQPADLREALRGVGAVVHLAGLAHVPAGAVSREEVWRVNVAATRALGEAAARAGVRLVFVSTAKVLGEAGEFSDEALPAPPDLYAESKRAAEEALGRVPGLQATVLRPPLVYGPGVGANFLRLLWLADSDWPLPFASLHNQRSLLYVDNLADAVAACLRLPQSAGRTYLVSDGEPLSLAELVGRLAAALGRPRRQFAVPASVLRLAARLAGHAGDMERLAGTFVLRDERIRSELGWRPPISLDEGLRATAAWYRAAGAANGA